LRRGKGKERERYARREKRRCTVKNGKYRHAEKVGDPPVVSVENTGGRSRSGEKK